MDEQTLEPCPFCGANEEGFKRGKTGCPMVEELTEGGWRVTCYTCCYSIAQSHGPTRGKFETPEAAIAAWNRRAAHSVIAGKVAELEATNAKLRRCLLPVVMTFAQAECVDEPIPDDAVVLSFMGSGASDQVTAGEVRAALAPYPERRSE